MPSLNSVIQYPNTINYFPNIFKMAQYILRMSLYYQKVISTSHQQWLINNYRGIKSLLGTHFLQHCAVVNKLVY